MKLGSKITLGVLTAVAFGTVISLIIEQQLILDVALKSTKNTMHATIVQAESIRFHQAKLNEMGAINTKKLIDEISNLKNLDEVKNSELYNTIPIVTAWKNIQTVADDQNFEFRIPKVSPRNKKNNPTPEEKILLDKIKAEKLKEYYEIDEKNNELVYARPIVLTRDCLSCHGDPRNSPTKNGKDLFGFDMENWKSGEIHGAFVLKAKLKDIKAQASEAFWEGATSTILSMLVVMAIIAACFIFFNKKYIIHPLSQALEQIFRVSESNSNAAMEISSSSMDLADGSSQQASAIEETSASLEEISSMTKTNAEHTANLQDMSSTARKSIEELHDQMDEMTDAMNSIKESSDGIVQIIRTIDEIAFQTNILALNAAVEAARAGEAGAGFAIVAEEVRTLAQRSANAARESTHKINESIARSERGVIISSSLEESLSSILGHIRNIDSLISQIACSTMEQSEGITQINVAVSQMDQVTQQNAATSETCASAAQEMTKQSEDLSALISSLTKLIGEVKESSSRNRPTKSDTDLFLQ